MPNNDSPIKSLQIKVYQRKCHNTHTPLNAIYIQNFMLIDQ